MPQSVPRLQPPRNTLPAAGRTPVLHAALALVLAACSADAPVSPSVVAPPPAEQPAAPQTAPQTTSTGVLRWSNPAVWPGGVLPAAGAAVVIGKDTTIVLDVETPALASLTVVGTLRFDESATPDKKLGITATRILVRGRLQAGTESEPFAGRATITLTGDETDPAVSTAKMLGVYEGGSLELHGERRTGWVRLDATAPAGSTTLTLDSPVDWRAGDRIVIASSDYDPLHSEQALVRSAQGTSVTIAAPLAYAHWGAMQTIGGRAVDERAEVGLLSRNLVVQGDASSATAGFGGHVMAMMGSVMHVEGVELARMGQRGRVARYPIHWHMMGDAPGQYARRNSIWSSYNRCVTVHGTHDVTVDGNVCYDHLGHGYFLEDGVEHGNTFRDNLGVLTRAAKAGQGVLPTDVLPATFWITNPDNVFVGNVAAGSQGTGFWFALPKHPTGLSTNASVWPQQTPLGRFDRNVAHSNVGDGLFVDHGPLPDGTTNSADYRPSAVPGDLASGSVEAVFSRYTGYKNAGRGFWARGQGMRFENAVLADNTLGAQVASPGWGAGMAIVGSLFVGESANRGSSGAYEAPQGFRVYDGPWRLEDVQFVNYPLASRESAMSPNPDNLNIIPPSNTMRGVRFENAHPLRLNEIRTDADRNVSFHDLDGSLTGTAGATVVADAPIRVDATCRRMAEWRAQVCLTPQVGLYMAAQTPGAPHIAPVQVRRDDGVTAPLDGYYGDRIAFTVPIGHGYAVTWPGASPSDLYLDVTDLQPGQWVDLELPAAAASRVDVRHRFAGDSWEMLAVAESREAMARATKTTSYLDRATGRFYLHIVGHVATPATDGCVLDIQTIP